MTILNGEEVQEKQLHSFGIDWEDFFYRWQKARMSAVRKVLNRDMDLPFMAETEEDLLSQLAEFLNDCSATQAEEIKELLLRGIFDFSRALALSLSKHYHIGLQLLDFRELLSTSNISCMQGTWETREAAVVLTRTGCNSCKALSNFTCYYWREAVNGLVMGLGDQEQHVRHTSVRNGDKDCVDVFFLENAHNRAAGIHWAKIPDQKLQDLSAICEAIKIQYQVTIEIKGFREGVLHYIVKDSTDGQCKTGVTVTKKFNEAVFKLFPDMKLLDVTPIAVMGVQA